MLNPMALVLMAAEVGEPDSQAVEQAVYHLSQADVESLMTLVSGMLSVNMFSLVVQLITLGVALIIIVAVTVRRI